MSERGDLLITLRNVTASRLEYSLMQKRPGQGPAHIPSSLNFPEQLGSFLLQSTLRPNSRSGAAALPSSKPNSLTKEWGLGDKVTQVPCPLGGKTDMFYTVPRGCHMI